MANIFDKLKELLSATDFVRNYGHHDFNWSKEEPENIARTKAAFIAGWFTVHGSPPSPPIMRDLEAASSQDETNKVIKEALRDDPSGNQIAAAAVAATEGELRPQTDEETMAGWSQKTRDGKTVYVEHTTGNELTPEQMRQSQVTDDRPSTLEQMLSEGVPAAEEELGPRSIPYVGGLPGEDTIANVGDPIFEPEGGPPMYPRTLESPIMRGAGTSSGFFDPAAVPADEGGYDKPEVKQRYHYGDQWGPASWDAPQVIQLKDQLISAGYLKAADAAQGAAWGGTEADAMQALMRDSNGIGEPWDVQLAIVANNPPESASPAQRAAAAKPVRAPFVAPSYLAPDMDLLKQAVKDSVRNKLGREPSAGEMAALIVGLDSDYRSAYDVQVQASRSEYDATGRAIDSGAEQSGGEFRMVDPGASFAERFESRFEDELGFKKRREDLNTRQSYTDATMRMIDSVAGGG